MKTPAEEKIARALLHEMDITFRRYYHQSLNDVVQELTLRNVLRSADPSATMLLEAIHETGLLQMRSASSVIQMREVLERYAQGILGTCTRCGRTIGHRILERNPSVSLCTRCRKKGARTNP